MWNTKSLVVLETMEYDMLDIANHGSHVPMYQSMVNKSLAGGLKLKPKVSYDEEDKRLIILHVKAKAAIIYSLSYHIYHLVQNCEFAQEMMETMTVAYEGTVEVQATQINNLKRIYEHFFSQQGETLTQTFNMFNYLINVCVGWAPLNTHLSL